MAVTEHDYLFSWLELYRKSLDAGIKPILGVELCYTPLGDGLRELGSKAREHQFHTTLLAKTNKGYRNLIKLASEAATTGFYYRPTYNDHMLKQYCEDIIMLSGCSSGYLARLILDDKYEEAVAKAQYWRDLLGDDFYVELMLHPVYEFSSNQLYRNEQEEFVKMETKVLAGLQQLSGELSIPAVVTNDAHYVAKSDAELHDIVFTMGQRKKMEDDNRYRYACPEFYLKTKKEMLELGFSSDVLDISLEIADKCNVTIDELDSGKYLMPKYPKLPEGKGEGEHLREMSYKGLKEKGLANKEEYVERLEHELGVINKLGWPSYFLVLADILDFCEKKDIPRGTSRGSAGGSLVSYCVGITKVDPIKHDLLFSRFMSEDRVSMPDIDVDVSRERRDEVIQYIADTYGQENVCQIGTIGLLATKAAIKKAATVFSVDFEKANLLTSYIQGPDLSVKTALKIPEVAEIYQGDPEIKRVMGVATQIENMPQFVGQHAAGIIISPKPIVDFIPVRYVDGRVVSQWTMEEIESLGALKLDLLGLKTTDLIWDTIAEIERNRGISIDVDAIPMDDPKTYGLLAHGDTNGVFQVESELCKMYLKRMRPKRFEDVENILALIRPGPLDAPAPSGSGTMVDEFIRRMHRQSPVTYPHPTTEAALRNTLGICLTGDTLVYNVKTGERVPISKVPIGMMVQGVDCNDNKRSTVSKVTNWVCNGYRDVLEIKIRDGNSIKATPNHKFLTEKGWVEACDLRVGDYIGTPYKLNTPFTSKKYGEDKLRILVNSSTKFVPENIFLCPEDEIAFFLACLWDCDGYTGDKLYTYKSMSKQLVYDIQHLLLRVGVPSVVSHWEKEGSWQVLVYDLESFNRTVAPHLIVKQAQGIRRQVSVTDNLDRQIVADDVRALRKQESISHFSPKNLSVKPRISKGVVRRIAEKLPNVLTNMAVRWEPIVSISDAGKELVYDITVDRIHNFIANNIIVHNCVYQEQVMRIAQDMAGFTGAEADSFRRTVAKKRPEEMPIQKEKFVQGCLGREVSKRDAERVFDVLETFSGYGFNKCVSGDTVVYRASANQYVGRKVTVKELCDTWDSNTSTGKKYRWQGLSILGLVDDRVKPVKLINIWSNGIKDVYRLTTVSGNFIKATLNHRFLTPEGWVPLKNIKPGDILYEMRKWDRGYPIYEDEVVSIEYAGREETFDLEVEEHHNFIANNIVTHNSHSCGYAVLTVQTAWLRTHYYPEFMASLLSSVMSVPDKLSLYLRDCHYHSVQVKPPSINTSTDKFVADGDDIRFALSAIKGIGNVALEAILTDRKENGPYQSFRDFILRIYGEAVNKTVLESLVKCGAFDEFEDGLSRKQMTEAVPEIIKAFNSYKGKIKRIEDNEAKAKAPIEGGSLDELEKERIKREERLEQLAKKRVKDKEELLDRIDGALMVEIPEFTSTEMAGFEKELLGHYVSNHPLDAYKDFYNSLIGQPEFFVTSTNIDNYIGETVITCGYIASSYQRRISTGFKIDLTLEDWDGSFRVIAYNQQAERFRDIIKPHNVVVVVGRVIHYSDANMTYIRLDDADIAQKEPLKPHVLVFVEQEAVPDVQNYVLQKGAANGEVYISIVQDNRSITCGPAILRRDINEISNIEGVHCILDYT